MKLIVHPSGNGISHFCGDYDATPEYPVSWEIIWVTQATGQAASEKRAHALGGDPRTLGIMSADDIRYHRDASRLIDRSQWILGEDAPFSAEQVSAWKVWRQALRDAPKCPDPNTYAWPAPPDASKLKPL